MRTKLEILTEICNEAGFSVTVNEFGEVVTANQKPMNMIDNSIIDFFGVIPFPKLAKIGLEGYLFPTEEQKKIMRKETEELEEYRKNRKKVKNEMKLYMIPFDDIEHALAAWGEWGLFIYLGYNWFDHDDMVTICECIAVDRYNQ